ncbi:MAG: hypothetical protein R3A80_06525 [Bdellovibrionota bacterium]
MYFTVGRFADIADHFRRRSISLGQEGFLGSLFTYHLRLRNTYSSLASLIDNPNLSFLLEGAKGTGKARIAEEFVRLENISRKLLSLEPTKYIKVDPKSRYDILLSLYQKDVLLTPSFFYFTKLESFSLNEQELLSRILRRQDYREQNYRIALSCEESLVFMIQRGKILSELVLCLKSHTFSVPRLSERFEDFCTLVNDLSQRYGAKKELPPQQVIDLLTRIDYPENIDSLAGLIKGAVTRNPHPSSWTPEFIEKIYPLARPERTENILDFRERLRYQ